MVESRLDGDYLLRYMAVDSALAHWDGLTAFYCRDGLTCENHNFYFYQEEFENRFVLIPWDMDAVFLPNDYFMREGVPRWNDPPGNCTIDYMVFGIPVQEPACDPLVRGMALFGDTRYKAALTQLLLGPFQVATMNADLDRWAAQIRDSVAADPTMNQWQWERAVSDMKWDLQDLYDRAVNWRDQL